MEANLTVAIVLKPQGIRGEIKVKTLTDCPGDLSAFSRVLIGGQEYKLLKVRPQANDSAFITLKGIADRNAAELLRGKDVEVARADLSPLPEGRYYLVDVIGCQVVTDDGQSVGTICEITPARTDIYTVDTDGGQLTFVAAEGVILDVDLKARRVTVDKKRLGEVAFTQS